MLPGQQVIAHNLVSWEPVCVCLAIFVSDCLRGELFVTSLSYQRRSPQSRNLAPSNFMPYWFRLVQIMYRRVNKPDPGTQFGCKILLGRGKSAGVYISHYRKSRRPVPVGHTRRRCRQDQPRGAAGSGGGCDSCLAGEVGQLALSGSRE